MSTLSTTFGRGTFAAKPASPRAGYHYFATDHGIMYRYSGSAWEAVSATGLVFAFSTTTTDSDPGAGTIRFNNATPASVTILYVDDNALNSGADLGTAFDAITGARVLITQADDPAKYLLGEVTADADGTGYWKLTVTVDSSGTLIDDGALVSFLVLGGGGGGGTSAPWWATNEGRIISNILMYDGATTAIGHAYTNSSGTSYTRGSTGIGGRTDTDVPCNSVHDITPTLSQSRGFTVAGQDAPAKNGHYFRTEFRSAHGEEYSTYYLGFSDNNPATATNPKAIFKRAVGETNWQILTSDGTTENSTDSGVAFVADQWYRLEVYVYLDGATMTAKFWIDGVLVLTTTTNVPLGTEANLEPNLSQYWTDADVATEDSHFFTTGVMWKCRDAHVGTAYASL